jgi:diguanylate cyclase (GGDEF)-like protein
VNTSASYIHKNRRQVIVFSLVFITALHAIAYTWRGRTVLESVAWWLVSILGALIIIYFAYRKVNWVRNQIESQLVNTEKNSHRQAILARLSSGFAATQSEKSICKELAQRLKEVPDFDYVAVYLVDKATGNRVLKASFGPLDNVTDEIMKPGYGLCEKSILERRLVYTPDIAQETKYVPGLGRGSEIDVPIQYGEEILGVLVTENYKTNAFHEDDFILLTSAADQAAIALQHVKLLSVEKYTAEKLMILHEASQKIISASFDPQETYKAIHEAADQLMPCEAFCITILTKSRDEIEAVYLVDRNGQAPPIKISADRGLSGYVISTGKPLLVDDYLTSTKIKEIDVEHFGSPDHIRAFIAVPMRLGTEIIGILSAQSYQPHEYTIEDQKMLEMLAGHAAIALNNANLFNKMQHMAITDSLTDVFNRRYLYEMAGQEFSRSRRYDHDLSVIMLDLDYFKNINDTHGHYFGDLALKEIAQTLQENIRESDTLGRYGGDEFSILLPETDLPQAIEIAERLRSIVAEKPLKINNISFTMTISIGISSVNESIVDFSHLLISADMALYEAKNAGRNCVRSLEFPKE